MSSSSSSSSSSFSCFHPMYSNFPGFGFNPTDEELVNFYLEHKVQATLIIPPALIPVVDFYHHDPWELSTMAPAKNNKYLYYFVPRDRKHPNGSRPRRVTKGGYWKATGTDSRVYDLSSKVVVGLKKTLVFYRGRAPRGSKTNWVMNEFRLPRTDHPNSISKEEFDVTLCRMHQKSSGSRSSARFLGHPREGRASDQLVEAAGEICPPLEDGKPNSPPSSDVATSDEQPSPLQIKDGAGDISELFLEWSSIDLELPELKSMNAYTLSSSWPISPTSTSGHCLWEKHCQ